jgi:uncharacterized protein YdhG (YjbR/CyaY superfamily)
MQNVDDYIKSFPEEVQKRLQHIRNFILCHAPEVEESMAYAIPAYKTYGKPLVYFAGFKNHIGFYATPTGHETFAVDLSKYKQGKGSVQFPLNQPMPYDLIERIIIYRVLENSNHANSKLKNKP